MPMDIPWHILKRKELQPLERLTLSVLYLHATPDDLVVFPKNDQLIECTGLSSRAIARHMAKLERLGFIERIRKGSHKRDVRLVRGVPPVSRDSSGTCHQRHPDMPPVAVDNTIGKNQLTNQVDSRPKGQPLAANNAQLSLSEMSRLTTELPKPPSGREVWVKRLWGIFTSLHHQVQDRLIEAGAAKRRSDFPFRPAYKRMLGTLYREKYSEENLGDAWIEMAKNAEDQQSLKYFRPSTCFVAKNINRSLEDRVNDEAKEIGEC